MNHRKRGQMKKSRTACLILLGITGCQQKPVVKSKIGQVPSIAFVMPCPKESDQAALNKVYPLLSAIGEANSESELRHYQYILDCLREWAVTLTDHCQREGIEGWLDYYQGHLNTRRANLANRETATDGEKRQAKYREEQARVRQYETSNPFPAMPRCEPKEGK